VGLELREFGKRYGRSSPEHRIIQIGLDDTPLPFPELQAVEGLSRQYPRDPGEVDPKIWFDVTREIVRGLTPADSEQSNARAPKPPIPSPSHAAARKAPIHETVAPDEANSQDDHAIVIGITSYPSLGDLRTASADARAFATWLTEPGGGAISPSHMTLTTSDDPSSEIQQPSDITAAFEPLARQAASDVGQRIGRRLYIFASGRGASSSFERLALCPPSASATSAQAIDIKEYAEFFKRSGTYDEVVLFADCHPVGIEQTPLGPARTLAPGHGRSESAFMYVSAQRRGGSQRPGGPNADVGPFTQALLEGLRRARTEGVVSSETLVRHLTDRLPALTYGSQEPVFLRGGLPIVFGSRAATVAPVAPDERVSAHADNPALIDKLGRRPFAEIIASRIDQVRNARTSAGSFESGAFMVNVHGPWGAGKTSVLNFLKANLQDEQRKTKQRDDRWVVVEFNAWRHQRLQPPWWSLIKEIQSQAVTQLSPGRAIRLRALWLFWRLRADWLPSIVSLAFIALALLLATGVVSLTAPTATSEPAKMGEAVELSLNVIVALLATGAGVVAFSRSLLFGSAAAAQAYIDARSDPLSPIIRLFKRLVLTIKRPVVVFIDDLDRCDGAYVIALLEGIQTLFRSAPVTYVVAADRKWICSCFEKRYEDFTKTIGEPGRPLGYLFLDKVFQVSAAVPRLSSDVQRTYWQALLGAAAGQTAEEADTDRKNAEQAAQNEIKGIHTKERLDAKIQEAAAQGPLKEQVMRAAVAKQITSPEALQATEHRLQAFAHLLEANPRSMKRLVNAYGFYQATHILEGRTVSPDALARWTIVELRWPVLAEYIAARPEMLDGDQQSGLFSKAMRRLLDDEEVKRVLGTGAGGRGALSSESIREIVGTAEVAPRPQVKVSPQPPAATAPPQTSPT
jgi:hypothetical protein